MSDSNRIRIKVDQAGSSTVRGRKEYNFTASGQNSTGIAARHLESAYHNNMRLHRFVGIRKDGRFELALTGAGSVADLHGLAVEWNRTRCLQSRTLEDQGSTPYRIEIEGRPLTAQPVEGRRPVSTGLASEVAARIAEDFDATRLVVRVPNPDGVCPLINVQVDVLSSPLRMRSFEGTFSAWCRERRLEFRVTPLADPPDESDMALLEPPNDPATDGPPLASWPDLDEYGIQYASPDLV